MWDNELNHDGGTRELSDGSMLRLKVIPDYDYSINDYDSDGTMSQTFDYIHDGHSQRPDGFDGSAVKVEIDRGHWAWWQPYKDAVYPDLFAFNEDKRRIELLAQIGFVSLTLELCKGTDAYGEPIVHNIASLGGLEWDCLESEYGQEIVNELIDELGVTVPHA